MGKIKEAIAPAANHNILASGTQIIGDISAEEDFRIDGDIQGNISCEGKVVIGNNSRIKGDIKCMNLELFGNVEGNISCNENVILRASAVIKGDIKSSTIEIEVGAIFEGNCARYQQ